MNKSTPSSIAKRIHCDTRMEISRRNWLGMGIWMSIQPKTHAEKPMWVLALDELSFWYLGNATSQLVTVASLQTIRNLVRVNDDNKVVVVMDLGSQASHALLNEVTQYVRKRHATVYGIGLAPFKFEGPARQTNTRFGWLQLQDQTDGCRLVRSEEAAEMLGANVTWTEVQGYLMEVIQQAASTVHIHKASE